MVTEVHALLLFTDVTGSLMPVVLSNLYNVRNEREWTIIGAFMKHYHH